MCLREVIEAGARRSFATDDILLVAWAFVASLSSSSASGGSMIMYRDMVSSWGEERGALIDSDGNLDGALYFPSLDASIFFFLFPFGHLRFLDKSCV